jgi:hypothetical protein
MSDNDKGRTGLAGIGWWFLGALLVLGALIYFTRGSANTAYVYLSIAAGYTALLLVFLYGVIVLYEMVNGSVDVAELIGESGGGASMSRFQLLIFTFVIALGIVFLLAKDGKFPELTPNLLALVGISASTYAVSKGIQASSPGMPPKGQPAKDGGSGQNPPTPAATPPAAPPPGPH